MNKKTKVSKNFFHGKATGNFQVIGTKGWGVVPPQWYLTVCTLIVTVGPSIVQLRYNNLWFVENKRDKWNLDKDKADQLATGFNGDFDFAFINAAYILTLLCSCCTLLKGAITDPGIIPRNLE